MLTIRDIERLTTGPVLETLEGCRRRIATYTAGELFAVMSYFGTDSVVELTHRLHQPQYRRKRTTNNQSTEQ